jgi:hypothetical protein
MESKLASPLTHYSNSVVGWVYLCPRVNRPRTSHLPARIASKPGDEAPHYICLKNTDYRMQNMRNLVTAVSFDSCSLMVKTHQHMQNYAKVGGARVLSAPQRFSEVAFS